MVQKEEFSITCYKCDTSETEEGERPPLEATIKQLLRETLTDLEH
jgi:hypothetical protein